MSARERLITQIELLPEDSIQRVIEFVSIESFNHGIYNKAITKPLCIDDLTEEQLNMELQKGVDSINAGRIKTVQEVEEKMQRLYNKYGV